LTGGDVVDHPGGVKSLKQDIVGRALDVFRFDIAFGDSAIQKVGNPLAGRSPRSFDDIVP
jgi:hypothetical protein